MWIIIALTTPHSFSLRESIIYVHIFIYKKNYKTHPKKMIKKNGNPRNFIFMIKANPTLISFTTFSIK